MVLPDEPYPDTPSAEKRCEMCDEREHVCTFRGERWCRECLDATFPELTKGPHEEVEWR